MPWKTQVDMFVYIFSIFVVSSIQIHKLYSTVRNTNPMMAFNSPKTMSQIKHIICIIIYKYLVSHASVHVT